SPRDARPPPRIPGVGQRGAGTTLEERTQSPASSARIASQRTSAPGTVREDSSAGRDRAHRVGCGGLWDTGDRSDERGRGMGDVGLMGMHVPGVAWREIRDAAVLAEELGYSCITMGGSGGEDALTSLGRVAAGTPATRPA